MKKKYPAQVIQFGKKVKELRITNELTQDELSKKCGISSRTILRIESGEFAAGLHIVFSLAQALKVKPSELLESIKVKTKVD